MVVGVVLDRNGDPICSELWAGQHGRREEPGSHRGTVEEPIRNRLGVYRCRPRDDQRRDSGGSGRINELSVCKRVEILT